MLPQLSSLTHLGLVNYMISETARPQRSQPSLGIALRRLDLTWYTLQTADAGHRWRHIFPPRRQLLHLTALTLRDVHPRMTTADLQTCVACCPNLQYLTVARGLAEDVQQPAMLQLSSLTGLSIDFFRLKPRCGTTADRSARAVVLGDSFWNANTSGAVRACS